MGETFQAEEMSKKLVFWTSRRVFWGSGGSWRKQVFKFCCFHGHGRSVGSPRPFQALSGNRSGNQECLRVAFPCPTSRPSWGQRPPPDHSCLTPNSEVARKAGKEKLFDFQGFPSWPGGRQPERQQLVTACLTAFESRQLLKATIGRQGGWRVREHGPVDF